MNIDKNKGDVTSNEARNYATLLAAETHKRAILEQKLSWHLEYLTAVESERDDLREAVLHLVKKVEQAQPGFPDFSLWPRSRLTVERGPCQNCLDIRDERAAHVQYREDAERHIRELEARRPLEVADRDIADPSRATSLLSIITTTAKRNRALEDNLAGLFDNVLQLQPQFPSSAVLPTLTPSMHLLSLQIDQLSTNIDELRQAREAFQSHASQSTDARRSVNTNEPLPLLLAINDLTEKVTDLGMKIVDLRLSRESLRADLALGVEPLNRPLMEKEIPQLPQENHLPVLAFPVQVDSETDTVVVPPQTAISVDKPQELIPLVQLDASTLDGSTDEQVDTGPYTPEIVLAGFLHQRGSSSEIETESISNTSSRPHTPYSEFGERPMELATPLSVHSFLVNEMWVLPTSLDAPGVLRVDGEGSGSEDA